MEKSFREMTAVAALAGMLTTGCYSYVPVQMGEVPQGQEVRVVLTRPGFANLPEMPTIAGPDLSGRIVRADAQQLLMRVPMGARKQIGSTPFSQDVAVPADAIIEFERRQFNRTRTAFAVAGGLAVASAFVAGFRQRGAPNAANPEVKIDEEAGVGFSMFLGLPISLR